MTPYEELHKKFKLTPQDGESFESFALRATKRVNGLTDAEWGELSEPVQLWINAVLKARDTKQAIPELDGYPTPAEGAAEEDREDVGEDVLGETADEPDTAAEGSEEAEQQDVVDEAATEGVEDAPEAEATVQRRGGGRVQRAKPAPTPRPKKSQKAPTGKGKDKVVNAKTKRATGKDRIADDCKIKIVAKENPHRAGSKLHGYFRKYKDGMTVAAAKKAGIPPKNIQYLQGLGSIKVIAA